MLAFTSGMWGTAHMTERGIEIHTLHLYNTSMQMIHAYEKVKHLDHFAQETSQKKNATISFSALNARSKELRDFLLEFKHLHGLITHDINLDTGFTQWLSLYRSNADHQFSVTEIDLLDNLFPHLMQSLAINRKVYLETLVGDEGRERWSVAIADKLGVLYHLDAAFQMITKEDHVIWEADRLSGNVLQTFKETMFELTGKHSVVQGIREGDLLFLKARKKVLADKLSQREYAIAKMLSSGMSLKEVAQKLGRSPETIRTHGKAIYEKLGTNKVTQLSHLLAERT